MAWHTRASTLHTSCADLQTTTTRLPGRPACVADRLLRHSPLQLPQVSALRFLSQKGLCNCDFIVASTAVCTGSSLLASMVAEGPQQLAAEA